MAKLMSLAPSVIVFRPPRGARASPKQYSIIVDYMVKHPTLAKGKLTPSFTAVDRRHCWNELAALLNSKGLGAQKHPDKWKKTWNDWKCMVKAKALRGVKNKDGAYDEAELSAVEARLVRFFGWDRWKQRGDADSSSPVEPPELDSDTAMEASTDTVMSRPVDQRELLPYNSTAAAGPSSSRESLMIVKEEVPSPKGAEDLSDSEGQPAQEYHTPLVISQCFSTMDFSSVEPVRPPKEGKPRSESSDGEEGGFAEEVPEECATPPLTRHSPPSNAKKKKTKRKTSYAEQVASQFRDVQERQCAALERMAASLESIEKRLAMYIDSQTPNKS